jgi:acetyl esterase/lipase
MNRIAAAASVIVCLSLTRSAAPADEPIVVDVWPGKAPDDYGEIGPEKFRPPWDEESKTAKWVTAVTKPTITVHRPVKEQDTGVAMLIFPGGGYWNLAWDKEGEEVAAWLNSIGVTGIILKYRVPRRPGQPVRLPPPGPLQDSQRSVSLVRSKAKEWGIDPHRIGIVGFSAGGHLSLATATGFEKRTYQPIDDVDKVSCRPDFAVALYSGYLVVDNTETLAPSFRIPAETPPVLLVHASDDPVSNVDNSVVMYQSLKRAGVRVEMHIYATGGHFWGVRPSQYPCSTWPARCVDWLRSQGVLPPISGK